MSNFFSERQKWTLFKTFVFNHLCIYVQHCTSPLLLPELGTATWKQDAFQMSTTRKTFHIRRNVTKGDSVECFISFLVTCLEYSLFVNVIKLHIVSGWYKIDTFHPI
jgi:hypothetical protein